MNEFEQEIETLKEGCEKRTDFEGNGFTYNRPVCSWGNLCEVCRAKLQTWKQALTSEIKFLEYLHNDFEKNPDVLTWLRIDIRERIAELKGALE